MNTVFLRRGLPALSIVAVAIGAYVWLNHAHALRAEHAPAPPPVVQAVSGLPDFSAIVKAYGPSVVNITVASGAHAMDARMPDPGPDSPFSDFFRRFGVPTPSPDNPRMAEGSGFIVSADGVILTNAHVVDDAREVTVKLTDRREFKAKVVGLDAATDVAVLKIDAKGLPTVRPGDPAKLQAGEWVLAIGSPFGFDNSVTAGIVSAKARALPDANYVPFIQTDVAVNPGNSGGPLFNLRGEVVGINSQIYSRSGGYQGVSFAIPIDIAMQVEKQLVEHGRVVRGYIGAAIQDMNQELAGSFGLRSPDGALVASVEPGGSAARAGLRAGDIVLAVDGRHIGASKDLPPLIASLAPGIEATVDIWRDHRNQKLRVKIGEQRSRAQTAAAEAGDSGAFGLALRPLSAEERTRLHAEAGLRVAEASGAAARAGIRAGDVILAANGTPLRSVEQLSGVAKHAGPYVAFLIQRGDERLFVPVRTG